MWKADASHWTTAHQREAAERDRAMRELRAERDRRLAACDWTQAADSPLSGDAKARWAAYRQELRDMPATADPTSPHWPERPVWPDLHILKP